LKSALGKEISYGFTAALYSLPFALYMSFTTGLDLRIMSVVYAVFALLSVALKTGLISAQVYAFLPVLFVFVKFGILPGLLCTALTSVISVILFKLPYKKFLNTYVAAGITIMLAFCATALFTTDYFGIGAGGGTVSEILRAYRFLGFHPNWRGVLYGTVSLVIMITYPRTFKKLKARLPAPAIAVFVPYILNLFLNPVPEMTYINESSCLYDLSDFSLSFSGKGVVYIVIGALASSLILQTFREKEKSLVFGAPKLHAVAYDTEKSGFLIAFVYILVFFAAVFSLKTVIIRIPVHSLAVVLIVTAWQGVEWENIAKAFRNGLATWLLLVLTFSCIFILDASEAVLFAFLISIIYNGVLLWLKK